MRYAISLVLTILVLFVSGVIYTNAKAQTPNELLEYYAKAPVIRTLYCRGQLEYVTLHDPSGKTVWRGVPNDNVDLDEAMGRFREMLAEQYGVEPFESINMFPDEACKTT